MLLQDGGGQSFPSLCHRSTGSSFQCIIHCCWVAYEVHIGAEISNQISAMVGYVSPPSPLRVLWTNHALLSSPLNYCTCISVFVVVNVYTSANSCELLSNSSCMAAPYGEEWFIRSCRKEAIVQSWIQSWKFSYVGGQGSKNLLFGVRTFRPRTIRPRTIRPFIVKKLFFIVY